VQEIPVEAKAARVLDGKESRQLDGEHETGTRSSTTRFA